MGAGRRLRARLGAWAALAPCLLGVAPTRAAPVTEPPGIPPECGSRDSFDAELKQRLGNDAPLGSVQVSIQRGAVLSHLRVQIGSEVRELADASCRELFRASVVVAVAMLLHDDTKLPPASTPSPPPPKAPPPRREFPLYSLGAGAGLNVGTLPKPVLALELESRVLWQYVGMSAHLRYLASATQLDENEQGAKIGALGGGVAGIFRPSRLWAARLGFAAQRLSGDGTGSRANSSDTVWAAGPTLGLNFVPLQLRSLWLGLGAEGQLNVVRGRFEILNYSGGLSPAPRRVHQVEWLSGNAFVRFGLVW